MDMRKMMITLLLLLTVMSCFPEEGEKEEEDVHSEEMVPENKSEEVKREEEKIEAEKKSECKKLYNEHVALYEKTVGKLTDEFYNRKFTQAERKDIEEGKKEISEEDAQELSEIILKDVKNLGMDEKKIDEFYERCEGYETGD